MKTGRHKKRKAGNTQPHKLAVKMTFKCYDLQILPKVE